jgi:hypothetical protein
MSNHRLKQNEQACNINDPLEENIIIAFSIQNLSTRGREITLVALILISEVFLNTFFIAFISARSPAIVEVACAFM